MGALIALNVVPVHSGGSGASPAGARPRRVPGVGPRARGHRPRPASSHRTVGRRHVAPGLPARAGAALRLGPGPELQPSGDPNTLPVASCDVAVASPTRTPDRGRVTHPDTHADADAHPDPDARPPPRRTRARSSRTSRPSPATIYYPWGRMDRRAARRRDPRYHDDLGQRSLIPRVSPRRRCSTRWPDGRMPEVDGPRPDPRIGSARDPDRLQDDTGHLNYYVRLEGQQPGHAARRTSVPSP